MLDFSGTLPFKPNQHSWMTLSEMQLQPMFQVSIGRANQISHFFIFPFAYFCYHDCKTPMSKCKCRCIPALVSYSLCLLFWPVVYSQTLLVSLLLSSLHPYFFLIFGASTNNDAFPLLVVSPQLSVFLFRTAVFSCIAISPPFFAL
jgi:hypothetical protein